MKNATVAAVIMCATMTACSSNEQGNNQLTNPEYNYLDSTKWEGPKPNGKILMGEYPKHLDMFYNHNEIERIRDIPFVFPPVPAE